VTPAAFVELLGRKKASAILRTRDQTLAADAMQAAIRGGFRIVEFTLTIPGALELISEFAVQDGLVVGAGTVLDVEQAEAAVAAGARFLVSPVIDRKVVEAATRLGVASMPGIHTPTEAFRAHRAGAPLQKLFPAPAGGPAFVRSMLGPMPFLRIVPTNGVDAGNFREWLAAGAHACGFVTSLFTPDLMKERDFAGIEARASEILSKVR
jgi:Entner-Doudoroff aldolase